MLDEVRLGTPPATLTLSQPFRTGGGVERLLATLDALSLHASRTVEDPDDLDHFLYALGQDWKGWDGPRSWESLDGELRLSCVHDRIGHVTCTVTLGQGFDYERVTTWEATAAIPLDPGMLEEHASEVHRFLAPRRRGDRSGDV